MNRSGMGIGSGSVVLVFAVLCLSVFALISYTAAGNDKTLAEIEARMVGNYYEADTLAELILAEILTAGAIPRSVGDVEITSRWDRELAARTAEFSCPMSDDYELYVKIALRGDTYDILSWRSRNTGAWEFEDSLPVWLGD